VPVNHTLVMILCTQSNAKIHRLSPGRGSIVEIVLLDATTSSLVTYKSFLAPSIRSRPTHVSECLTSFDHWHESIPGVKINVVIKEVLILQRRSKHRASLTSIGFSIV
jgi:hypothetical protein